MLRVPPDGPVRVRPVPVTAGWGLLLLLLLGGGPASARQRPRVRRALPHLKPTPTTRWAPGDNPLR